MRESYETHGEKPTGLAERHRKSAHYAIYLTMAVPMSRIFAHYDPETLERIATMTHSIPTDVLRYVRDAADLTQAALAKLIGTVPSVLSKLERAEEAEPEMAERYLSAIASDLAKEVQDYYGRTWLQERPPSFLHPDREDLWTINQALADLAAFAAENNDPILRGPIGLLEGELRTAEAYLRRRDHVIAWVGDIGVGKTTALTYAVGLLVGDGRSGRKPAFPVGSGRTTVCETAIRSAPTYGILVDALEDEEVLRLTRELVSSLVPGATGSGVSAEISRVLRNMSETKPESTLVGDEIISIDPIVEYFKGKLGIDEITDRLVAAMKLADRRERQIILPEGSEDGLTWVSTLVTKINNGLEKRFSVPRRITVLMPSAHLGADSQSLQVVDTRGVESVTQRPDLAEHSDDPRTLMVLCTKFADAPNTTVQRQLQESVESGSDAAEKCRQCILVLPRGDEALEMPGFDLPLPSRQQGYAIRRKDVQQALSQASLPQTSVYFFDARNDDPEKFWAQLRSQVASMRAVYGARGRAAAEGVANLRDNVDSVRAAQARKDVEQEMERILGQVADLPDIKRLAHQNLMDQMAIGHHSSIAASIVRRGEWNSFQFSHILGQGVRIDANLRTSPLALRIEHKLDDLEDKYQDLAAVVRSLQALRERLAERRQDFLAIARIIGRDAYGSLLDDADIWTKSASRYGQGSGYKRDVASMWRDWFETSPDAADTAKATSHRLQDAWTSSVIEPLLQTTRSESDGTD
ncbi:helix-turn-helix domain-containing protein [Methylobacterium sp. WL9]|uniref:helix-turn-helix domain-containing protein n=1 Tax=Methylobacterium sp. WL9 TaxID=2603898 RepID=UPI0011D8FFA7|nr:helix-turn-helix domain-containing protein [Methylobacterium sp. WL9]TXN25132.1 helix-turn-helix domain-containing protein [Methylobacterium sp. WL9]